MFIGITLMIASVGLALSSSPGDEEREASRLINDCGVNSLYLLLRLRSEEVDLAELRRALPSTEAEGLSMSEIQAASGRRGVPLRGVRIGPGDVPIDRPVITLLRPGGGMGHFVVLEPVGVLDKMVMVLDFPRPARVVDYAELIKHGDWAGAGAGVDPGAVGPVGPLGAGGGDRRPGPGLAPVEPPGRGAAQSGSRSGRGRPLTGDWAGVSL